MRKVGFALAVALLWPLCAAAEDKPAAPAPAAAAPATAPAEAAPAPQPTRMREMVVMPRDIVEAMLQWISLPNATNAVQLFFSANACLSDNPSKGLIQRMGEDRCADVSKAIEDRMTEVSDLKKRIKELEDKIAGTSGGGGGGSSTVQKPK